MTQDWKIIWSATPEDQHIEWRSLLDEGAPTDASLEHILCRAIVSKDYDLVQTCLSHNAQLNDWVYGAVVCGLTIDLMRIFIPAGLDVNYQNDRTGGYVAMTASSGNLEFTRFLLEHGADPNINPLADFYPALCVAMGNDNVEMAELLTQYGARVNGLGARGEAAKRKRYAMMEFQFRHGTDVNDDAKECDDVIIGWLPGTTALHEAAAVGDVDVLGYLIQRGADLASAHNNPSNPAMVAREEGHQEAADFLNNMP